MSQTLPTLPNKAYSQEMSKTLPTLPNKAYSQERIINLFIKDENRAKKYFEKYFYPIDNPIGWLYYQPDKKTFDFYRISDIIALLRYIKKTTLKETNEEILKLIPKETNEEILKLIPNTKKQFIKLQDLPKKDERLFSQVSDIKRETFFEKNNKIYLNTAGFGIDYQNDKQFQDYTEEIKNGVNFIWDHISTVLCSSDEKVFIYVKNWIINMINLNKNKTCLYFRSVQGTGKSSICSFLTEIIGQNGSTIQQSGASINTNFNSCFKNKVLAVFEELSCSSFEWNAMSNKLKAYITEETMQVEEKYKEKITINNYLNVIISTNNNDVKISTDDRRYVICDVSSEKVGNVEYFNELYKYLNNPEIKHAFYSYCVTNYDKKFNPRIIPITNTKKEIIIDNMHKVFKFIKETYLLRKKPIELIQCKKLFEDFQNYTNNSFQIGTQSFSRKIKELSYFENEKIIGIQQKTKHHVLYFSCSYEELLAVFTKKALYDPLIDDVIDSDEEKEINYINDDKLKELETRLYAQQTEFKLSLAEKDKQIEELMKKLNKYENKQNTKKQITKKKVIKESESEYSDNEKPKTKKKKTKKKVIKESESEYSDNEIDNDNEKPKTKKQITKKKVIKESEYSDNEKPKTKKQITKKKVIKESEYSDNEIDNDFDDIDDIDDLLDLRNDHIKYDNDIENDKPKPKKHIETDEAFIINL